MDAVDLTVHQKPEKVSFTCPECFRENEVSYEDFCQEHGEPWEWENIRCEECGKELTVEYQDWS